MPAIGIIGAQNVGKSTLFNSLIKKKKSITFDQPGVTRDLISETVPWGDGHWQLIDFPGFEFDKNIGDDSLTKAAVKKAVEQLANYSLLLFVVSRKGLSPYEHHLVDILRKLEKPVWLVVNHVDDPRLEAECAEYYSLGFSEIFFVSGLNNRNIESLRDSIIKFFSGKMDSEKTDSGKASVKLAIIGKPNAGKSTMFNILLQKERSLVYDQPGTTRDTIDETIEYGDHLVTIMDTAGLRKKRNVTDSVEFFSTTRTQKAIASADVVLFMINAQEGADHQNKDIIEWVEKENKPLILLINKCDLIDEHEKKELEKRVEDLQSIFWDFQVMYISAIDYKKSGKILNAVVKLYEKAILKIPTPRLNHILEKLKKNPVLGSNSISITYMTQAYPDASFILFTNREKLPNSIVRYIKHELRAELKWSDMPMKLDVRRK